MFNRSVYAYKNKNKILKDRRKQQQENAAKLRAIQMFQARLMGALDDVEVLLSMPDVDYVEIEVESKNLGLFTQEVYGDTLAEYDVEQVDGNPLRFVVRKRGLDY